ncbi:uncharacterized protein PSFLO_00091 [Pseudozyma flocculosa]|uniref:Uncharacterized protein n=1 Tax=Pseudozyma flocculosa TaxID=84751 RepID=A0A5C3ERX8_9BASI|nr:uncharacterized protein PSFLO_00091 [Pseudozyma flocculosa]
MISTEESCFGSALPMPTPASSTSSAHRGATAAGAPAPTHSTQYSPGSCAESHVGTEVLYGGLACRRHILSRPGPPYPLSFGLARTATRPVRRGCRCSSASTDDILRAPVSLYRLRRLPLLITPRQGSSADLARHVGPEERLARVVIAVLHLHVRRTRMSRAPHSSLQTRAVCHARYIPATPDTVSQV